MYTQRGSGWRIIFSGSATFAMIMLHSMFQDQCLWITSSVMMKSARCRTNTGILYAGCQSAFEINTIDCKKKQRQNSKAKEKGRYSSGWCKRGAKPKTKAELSHQCKKGTFNVFFCKSFGSKQLFCHLVKVGPDTPDLNALLLKWDEIRNRKRTNRRKALIATHKESTLIPKRSEAFPMMQKPHLRQLSNQASSV